jgi:hypothetical protein
MITTCGRICYQNRKINVSQVFAGQKVGVKQDGIVVALPYTLLVARDATQKLQALDRSRPDQGCVSSNQGRTQLLGRAQQPRLWLRYRSEKYFGEDRTPPGRGQR